MLKTKEFEFKRNENYMKKTKKKTKKTANNKVVKIKTGFDSKNLVHSNKLKVLMVVTILIFFLLVSRIGFIQFVQGNFLKEKPISNKPLIKLSVQNVAISMTQLEKLLLLVPK